jgi:hypothetical protein
MVMLEAGFSQVPVLSPGAQVLLEAARAITRLGHLGPSILVGASIPSRVFNDGTLDPRV